MFQVKINHICTVKTQASRSCLPDLTSNSGCWPKFLRTLKKLTLIAELNPRSLEYFQSYAEIINQRRQQIASNSWVIHPFSAFFIFYEMWLTLLLMMCLIIIPIDSSFGEALTATEYRIFETIMNISCFVDVVLRFNAGFTNKQEKSVVMKRGAIAKNYLLSIHMLGDLCSTIPRYPGYPSKALYWRIINILSLLKITRIYTLYGCMNKMANFFRVNNTFVGGVKMIVTTALLFHFFSCLFYLVPQFRFMATGSYTNGTFYARLNLSSAPFVRKYSISLLTSSVYLLGVDAVAGSTAEWEEFLVRNVAILFGKIYISFVIVYTLNLFLRPNALETKYFEVISQVKCYMSAKKLPPHMQRRILEYYKYKYQNVFFKENKITSYFSEQLMRDINYSVCNRLVQNVKLFGELPRTTVEKILINLKCNIYLPNDLIIKSGTIGDCMYFLSSGTVAVLSHSGKEVCHLQDGAYFGEISLLIKDTKRTANVVAIETCEIYSLDRKEFQRCFSNNQELLTQMENIAIERLEATSLVEDEYKRTHQEEFADVKKKQNQWEHL